ncbi:pyrin-like [Parambassis ranga]|uniref:Pyrin-like n=1 Tax=Parambassis ranga TaxID=210632 RepID=A0A6P7J3N1_9TELE|nr:pyrin-like [Parambassis ranga]
MNVPLLLLGALEDLLDEYFKTFKWYLSMRVLDSCEPIPKSRLEKALRPETVSKMIECYGEELAVEVTVKILRNMRMNSAAEELKKAHTARETSAPSTSSPAVTPATAAPAISAQQGGVIIAPMVHGGSTVGAWNITINKPNE